MILVLVLFGFVLQRVWLVRYGFKVMPLQITPSVVCKLQVFSCHIKHHFFATHLKRQGLEASFKVHLFIL